ncbi:MAG: hypothetical protein ACRCUS_08600, partial [Anaerovoracaceae bacterium]
MVSGEIIIRKRVIINILILIVTLFFLNTKAVSAASWHDVIPKPGQTYDISKASKNTKVLFNKSGNYWLEGTSKNVYVVIASGGVNLFLKDGLNINTSIYSAIGGKIPAITIEEQGGTVKIISCAGAN